MDRDKPAYIDYKELKIKDFQFWNLQLHMRQHPCIGRCYAWCKRNAKNVIEMNADEEKELFSEIIPQWWKAVQELYQSEWPNAACYGNTSAHLHWHLIPRFNGQRKLTFMVQNAPYEMVFEDRNKGKNYAPYEDINVDIEILKQIRKDIASKLK